MTFDRPSPLRARNFWLNLDIEGRESKLQGGPRRSDGGFTLDISRRHSGNVTPTLRILGQALRDPDSPLKVDRLSILIYTLTSEGENQTLIHSSEVPR